MLTIRIVESLLARVEHQVPLDKGHLVSIVLSQYLYEPMQRQTITQWQRKPKC